MLQSAFDSGVRVRVHTREGEVLVAQVIALDAEHARLRVWTSSRPENYAHCDSTGLDLPLSAIERAALLEPGGRRRRAR